MLVLMSTSSPVLSFFSAFAIATLALLAPAARAGGTPENVLLIVDPSNAESLYVANYYANARDIPAANVLYMSPTPASYAQFAGAPLDAFFGALENQHVADHIDYVVLPSGTSFYMNAGGLISDGCSPVTRFSSTAPYALAFQKAQILAGQPSTYGNAYYRGADDARAFDSSLGWAGGLPSTGGRRYFIAAMLGYTGANGNTLADVLAMIDRSVAVDGMRPLGTFYFMQTTDVTRSSPRDFAYPAAVAKIASLGGSAQHLMADLPIGQQDCLGIMTGLATPPIDAANLTVLPGAFCDHLTSYAATFDETSQTKMSRWIAKGASGTSGEVEEPCNYSGKFPHARLHVFYYQGLSLGEAWFRSHAFAPFQTLFTGDPLTRPFAYFPSVSLAGLPVGAASNTITLIPSATTQNPAAHIASFELLVDGRSSSTTIPGGAFALDTTAFADGWHDLRVLAYDDTLVKSVGRLIGSISIDNYGRAATLAVAPASGDLTQRFDFTLAASGGTVTEVRLVQGSRVIAASASSPAVLSVFGRTLGAGHVRVHTEATFSDGRLAQSPPVAIDVAYSSGPPGSSVPVAFGYTKHVRADLTCVVELPAAYDTDLSSASYTLLSSPAQASVQAGGSSAWRIVQPNAGASGSDTFSFRVDTPNGSSNVAAITLVYDAPFACNAPANYCATSPNTVGPGAQITSSGSTSIGANDFSLYAYALPPNSAGIFVYGPNATQVAFGNGFLCVGSPFIRLGVLHASFFGDVTKTLDLTQPPFNAGPGAITTGSTWNFQYWYRNAAAGGAGFNSSDGLRVVFCL